MEPRRILIVDDEIQVAKALRRLLLRDGYAVEVAHSAADGLARFEATRPDVVISDFYMPDRTGYQLVRDILERAPGTVAFLLSGSLEVSAEAAGCCEVLWKPWSDPELLARIRERLAARPPR